MAKFVNLFATELSLFVVVVSSVGAGVGLVVDVDSTLLLLEIVLLLVLLDATVHVRSSGESGHGFPLFAGDVVTANVLVCLPFVQLEYLDQIPLQSIFGLTVHIELLQNNPVSQLKSLVHFFPTAHCNGQLLLQSTSSSLLFKTLSSVNL